MKEKCILGAGVILMAVMLGGCGKESGTKTEEANTSVLEEETVDAKRPEEEISTFQTDPLLEKGLNLEEISVVIPGLTEEYHFLFLADLHIIVENEDVAAKDLETVRDRIRWSSVSEDTTAAEFWASLPEVLDACHADAVLLGGDMMDFCTKANAVCLREGLERLETPYMYVRADHDSQPYYCEGVTKEDCAAMHEEMDGNQDAWCMELPELCIAGLNNNTSGISEEGLVKMKEIFAMGKPVLLLAHVPFDSKLDTSLQAASKEVWQDRALVWGEGCNYTPDDNTEEFLDMLYAPDSPVKEVVCGHLHFTWDGSLTENTHQHVFSPALGKTVGVITVKGS